MNEFRARHGRPASRVYLSCGVYESLIYEDRSIVPLLSEQGIQVRFEELRVRNWERATACGRDCRGCFGAVGDGVRVS